MLTPALLTALVIGYAVLCVVALGTVFDRARLVSRIATGRARRMALARRVRELETDLVEMARASLASFDDPPPQPDGGEAAPAPAAPRPIVRAVAA